jgi:hypothetical protein
MADFASLGKKIARLPEIRAFFSLHGVVNALFGLTFDRSMA